MMGIYFYSFNKRNNRGLCLGKRLSASDGYQGPVIFIDGDRYLLPAKYLSLLISRFQGGNVDDVIIVPEYDLFDGELLSEDDEFVEVGGDTGAALLVEYLPELNSSQAREEIKRFGTKLA